MKHAALMISCVFAVLISLLLSDSQAHAQTATVLRVSGSAEVLSDPSAEPHADGAQVSYDGRYYRSQKPRIGLRLKDALIIRTGAGGKLTLAYQNGDLITISENTFYKILPVGQKDGKSALELIQGAVRSHVQKDGPLSGGEVRTNTLVMGVRGTDFYVARPGKTGDTELVVIRGKVEVSSPAKDARPVEVKTGQSTSTASQSEAAAAPASIEVVQADKGKLATIQVETAVAPEPTAVEKLPEEIREEVKKLEQKAASNILQDIKKETPEVYKSVAESGASDLSSVYAMNTAAVESLYVAAPEPPASEKSESGRADVNINPEVLFAKQPPPEAPALLRPLSGSTLTGTKMPLQVAFDWSSSKGAAEYELQVARQERFSPVKFSIRLSEVGHIAVLPASTWWWRIRSYDAQGRSGEWSTPGRFLISGDADPVQVPSEPESAPVSPPENEKQPEPVVAEEPTIPAKPDRFLVTIGIGGGGYSYNYERNGFSHNRDSSGGGSELSLYGLLFDRLFTSVSISGRSMDDFFADGEKQDYSVSRLSSAWLFDAGLPVYLGAGISLAAETVVHPRQDINAADKHSVETLFADVSLLSRSWPKSFFQLMLGYGVVAGSDNLDVRSDSTQFGRLRYQRQFFRFPLSLGMSMEYFRQTMRFHRKANDGEGRYEIKRQPVFFEAGYSF